jgi:glycine/D-amino acid oxidase-like deaminating enzyme
MKSLWQDIRNTHQTALTGQFHTDIVIVGAGYTGAWLAYWLRHSGLSAMVVEQRYAGYGASGRNGGLILQGPAQLLGEVAADWGEDRALEILGLTRQTLDWVNQLADQYAIDYRRTGSLYVGGDATERPSIEYTVALMQRAGIPAAVLDPLDQPPSLQQLGYDLALWVPDDAIVHPVKLIQALFQEATASGIPLYQGQAVDGFEEHPDFIIVTGPQFRIKAAHLVVATNAYTTTWIPAMAPWIQPVRGQMLATAALASLDHQFPVYADHGFNYWHQRPDGRLIAGGFRHLALDDEVGLDLTLHPRIQARLQELVGALVGHSVPITHRWAGIMAMTPDRRPYVGQWTSRVWIAGGYNGHGSSVAPVAAKMVAEALTDNQPIWPLYDVVRLKPGRQHPS